MKIARVLKYNEAQSETTTVDINDNKIAPASLQVLSWPSCLTDTPNSLTPYCQTCFPRRIHVDTPVCVVPLPCCPLCCGRTPLCLRNSPVIVCANELPMHWMLDFDLWSTHHV